MNENPSVKTSSALGLHEKVNAGDAARELVQGVKHSANEVADQARQAAESKISNGKDKAIDRLDSVANAIRKTGQHLREEDDGVFTDYFDRIARQVDDAAGYLRRRSLAGVMEDVESFARGEPALFLGGAFLAGLMGGRFLKSSKSAPAAEQRGLSPSDRAAAPLRSAAQTRSSSGQ